MMMMMMIIIIRVVSYNVGVTSKSAVESILIRHSLEVV